MCWLVIWRPFVHYLLQVIPTEVYTLNVLGYYLCLYARICAHEPVVCICGHLCCGTYLEVREQLCRDSTLLSPYADSNEQSQVTSPTCQVLYPLTSHWPCFIVFFEDRVSCKHHCPQTYCVAQAGIKLLIILSQNLKYMRQEARQIIYI